MNEQVVYFSLSMCVYAARYEKSIIVLNSEQDKYLSFIDDAACWLQIVLDGSFKHSGQGRFMPVANEMNYDVEQLNQWISHFLENGFIVECDKLVRKNVVLSPLISGGLKEYRWDRKVSWDPFLRSSKFQVIRAFFELFNVHWILKKKGIQGILDRIEMISKKKINLIVPSEQDISNLSEVVDAASLLYSKKTFCLAWASTFVILALKRNWKCNLAIGVQANPFYAHAWAESSNNVVHDDSIISQVLSVVLRKPNL